MNEWSFPSTSSSSSSSSALYPSRRRPRGPLHPPNRQPPSFVSQASTTTAFTSDLPNSVFLDTSSSPLHSRKRNWTPSLHLASAIEPSTSTPTTPNPYPSFDTATATHPSPNHHIPSPYSSLRAPTKPITTQPSCPPQGEFSFQPPTSGLSQNHPDGGAHDSAAFAKLAQAQRQQQENNRYGDRNEEEAGVMDQHVEGPMAKRRKGVAGTIVDGALNAALYTGAAAITAYSLWSSWGRQTEDDEGTPSSIREEEASSSEKLPPGALTTVEEPPPPPYNDGFGSKKSPLSPAPLSVGSSSQLPRSTVFLSNRRRRPAFATHKSMRSQQLPRKKLSQSVDQGQDERRERMPNSSLDYENMERSNGVAAGLAEQGVNDEGGDDEDEMYRRFQSKMSNLIAEGQAALTAKADLGSMDVEEEFAEPSTAVDYSTRRGIGGLTPSHSAPLFDPSRANGSREDPLTPTKKTPATLVSRGDWLASSRPSSSAFPLGETSYGGSDMSGGQTTSPFVFGSGKGSTGNQNLFGNSLYAEDENRRSAFVNNESPLSVSKIPRASNGNRRLGPGSSSRKPRWN